MPDLFVSQCVWCGSVHPGAICTTAEHSYLPISRVRIMIEEARKILAPMHSSEYKASISPTRE